MKKHKLIFFTFLLIPLLNYGQSEETSFFSKTFKYPNLQTDYVYRFGYKYNLYRKFEFAINADGKKGYEDTASIKNFTSNQIFIGRQFGVKDNKFIVINVGYDLNYNFNHSNTINYNQTILNFIVVCQIVKLRSEFVGSAGIEYYWGKFDTYTDNHFNKFNVFSPLQVYYKFIITENFVLIGNIGTWLDNSSSTQNVKLSNNWFYGFGLEYRIPSNFTFIK